MHLHLSRSAKLRAVPFAVFMVLLALRNALPANGSAALDSRWIYGFKAALVAGLLWHWRGEYGELARQNLPSWREVGIAVVAGLLVFALWISLDSPWMQVGTPGVGFRPLDSLGAIDWRLVALRWLGASLVVPVMEELFWRSFLMRWIADPVFESVAPARVGFRAVLLSTFVFALAHTLWLGGAIAGLVYAMLYVRSGKLWTAVIAHGVTNGVLGIWVVATGSWQFW
jgi:CAAX prenyl protease-like protein